MFEDVRHFHLLEPGRDFDDTRTFCLYCIDITKDGDGFGDERAVVSHLYGTHDIEKDVSKKGVHWVWGGDLVKLISEYHRVNDGLAQQFERQLCSIGTVDDFLFEAGS